MPRKAEDPLEVIKADIEQKYDKALHEMASEMTFQIEKAYETAISKFYNEYTPKVYDRTGSTLKASDRWDDIFGYDVKGDIFETGINVGAENIPFIDGHPPYRAPKGTAWVFQRTYEEGIHGYFKVEAQDSIKKIMRTHVLSKRRKHKYASIIESAPPLKSKPEKIMEKLFKRISSDKYMNTISKEILDEVFGTKN